MGLEGICALYSFKIDPPRPDMLRGGMRPLALDPYNRNADNLRRTLEKPDMPKPTPPGEEFGLPSPREPAWKYGLNGGGEASTIYPGLVQRTRDREFDSRNGFHQNEDIHSVLSQDFTKKVDTIHKPLKDLYPWLKVPE